MPSVDFDFSDSDLQMGIEVEYPKVLQNHEKLVHRGGSTVDEQRSLSSRDIPVPGGNHYDATVGLEIVSDPLDLKDAVSWYHDAVELTEQELNLPYQPTGLMDGGNTAGTHIHISPLDQEQAERLAELSREPWMQVLFCSSIAKDSGDDAVTWPVFRGGTYCQMGYADTNSHDDHYMCVNRCGVDHYEWRLPEPMLVGNMEILARFLALFDYDEEVAIEYAQERLDDADERITSIARAEALGMDLNEIPEVRREPSTADVEGFYEEIEDSWMLPEINTVTIGSNTELYVLESDLEGTMSVGGFEFQANDVLYADTLESVQDQDLRERAEAALNRITDERRETEATNELKKIIKEKK